MEANFKFFIYAWPAVGGCAKVDEDEGKNFLEMILKGDAPGKESLEGLFPNAFKKMNVKYGETYWSFDNIQNYWWSEHNRIIDNREGVYSGADDKACERCKVKFWKVKDVGNNGRVVLENDRGNLNGAFNFRKLGLENGVYVTTHKNIVIEEISFADYEKYG